jgi:pectinesterase
MQLTRRRLLLGAVALMAAGGVPSAVAQAPAPKLVRVVLVGDSTVAVASGWGPGFMRYLSESAVCLDLARGGRSSKSFVNEGHWKNALAEHPDYVLIQFGHNDQPGKGPERETDPASTFPDYLRRYVDEARASGAKPILVTSLTRRNFRDGKLADTLGPYAEATRKVAAEKGVPLIDLYARSTELVEKLGPKATEELEPANPDGKPGLDHTHLNAKGADVFGRLVAEELRKVDPALGKYVRLPN